MEEYLKPLLTFGVSLAGSAIQGAIIKHKMPRIDNDRIPVHTETTWGAGGVIAGQIMDDPLSMVAGFAGATVASLGHKLIGKLFSDKD
jgi:hypothetical protein